MNESLNLCFPECLAEDFPQELPVARAVVNRILGVLDGLSYDALERHSPALKENDWSNYLRCSIARMVHAAGALRRAGVHGGRLLDYGAYFGNFAGMFADLGFEVDAIDAFRTYALTLEQPMSLMRARGIRLLDFDDGGRDLSALTEGGYDVVLCAGVIEHIPHSPRGLLASLNRVLKPGGHLILDTPNLADLYKRQSLARGDSVWPPLDAQFYSPIPYEGHHREYTAPEVAWMLHEVGHQVQSIDLYNYSCYEQPELRGRDVANFWKTRAEPTLREYITTLSRRGERTTAIGPPPDWRTLFVESEPHWQTIRPKDPPPFAADDLVELEPLLIDLQDGIATRDRLLADLQRRLADLQEEYVRENAKVHQTAVADVAVVHQENAKIRQAAVADVTARDKTIDELNRSIAALNDQLGSLRGAFDAKLSEVFKRFWRRLMGT